MALLGKSRLREGGLGGSSETAEPGIDEIAAWSLVEECAWLESCRLDKHGC